MRFCIETLRDAASAGDFELLAYCFMPNHVHVLVQGLTESSSLRSFMKQFKQITGFAFKQEHGEPLWHRSYYDRVLRKEEDLHSAAAYIWGNPVRAALVECAEDYQHSGPAERMGGRANRLGTAAAIGGQTLRSVRTGENSFTQP